MRPASISVTWKEIKCDKSPESDMQILGTLSMYYLNLNRGGKICWSFSDQQLNTIQDQDYRFGRYQVPEIMVGVSALQAKYWWQIS